MHNENINLYMTSQFQMLVIIVFNNMAIFVLRINNNYIPSRILGYIITMHCDVGI